MTLQYHDKVINSRYETNLLLSKLINKGASIEKLKSGNGRLYNDATVQQILSFRFAADRKNVGVYGVTAAGKSYFLSACCNEACRLNYRCKFIDYCELLDEFIALNNKPDLSHYQKRLNYYARIQLLFIDDFGTSTLFSCQYSPDEWGKQLSYEEGCYGKLEGISRRPTTGYIVFIEREQNNK